MAEAKDVLDAKILSDVKYLLWGNDLKEDVFSRWSQGKVTKLNEQDRTLPISDICTISDFMFTLSIFITFRVTERILFI